MGKTHLLHKRPRDFCFLGSNFIPVELEVGIGELFLSQFEGSSLAFFKLDASVVKRRRFAVGESGSGLTLLNSPSTFLSGVHGPSSVILFLPHNIILIISF